VSRRLWLSWLASMVWLGLCGTTRAHEIEGLRVRGAKRTREDTMLALLPRPPPADYSEAELEDFERRLNNLAIFDRVTVARSGAQLEVAVREKWTLIPDFALATGKTPADLYLAAGATEYNFLGRAAELSVSAYREQRGLGFSLGLSEHDYRQHRWSYGVLASYGSASSRFDDGRSWFTTGPTLTAWVSSPPVLSRYYRYQVSLFFQSERIDEVEGDYRPPDGHAVQLGLGLTYDRYRWSDLVPRGFKLSVTCGPGFFVPAAQARHFAELQATAALPLARYTVLAARSASALSSRGNANASYLLGSIDGVRGLDDARYRNWAQSSLNVELRQAVPVFERLALQLVAFGDVAGFQRMDAFGRRGEGVFAAAVGLGARILPTFLAQFVLRFDMARLLAPSPAWFPQLGIAQYF
jgi:hypothetical protein